MAKFARSGGEANNALAARIARAATGRDHMQYVVIMDGMTGIYQVNLKIKII